VLAKASSNVAARVTEIISLAACVMKILGSTLVRDTDYHGCCAFLQSLQANTRIVTLSGHEQFLPSLLQFITHPNILLYVSYLMTMF
jgi:hypothetical protein